MTRGLASFVSFSYILLCGCAPEKVPSPAVATVNQTRQDDFQKKIACKSFEKTLKDEANEDRVVGTTFIKAVFYSSKENSCLVAKRTLYLKNSKEALEIDDVLSNKEVWYEPYEQIQDAASAEVRLDRKISELK